MRGHNHSQAQTEKLPGHFREHLFRGRITAGLARPLAAGQNAYKMMSCAWLRRFYGIAGAVRSTVSEPIVKRRRECRLFHLLPIDHVS